MVGKRSGCTGLGTFALSGPGNKRTNHVVNVFTYVGCIQCNGHHRLLVPRHNFKPPDFGKKTIVYICYIASECQENQHKFNPPKFCKSRIHRKTFTFAIKMSQLQFPSKSQNYLKISPPKTLHALHIMQILLFSEIFCKCLCPP